MAISKITAHFGLVLGGFSFAFASAASADTHATKTNDQSEYAVSYQINPAHSGTMKFKAGFKLPLTKLWMETISGASALSYPLIADGKVFVTALLDGEQASDGAYALDIATGSTVWSRTENLGTFYVGPAYDNGAMFFQTGLGTVEALSAKSGKLNWSLQLGSQADAALTAVNGLIYADDGATAIDEKTGNIQWVGDPVNAEADAPPAIGDKGVFIGGTCFYDKLNSRNGNTDWQYTSCQDYGVNADPTIYYSGRAYIEDDFAGNFILDANTGSYEGTFNCNYRNHAGPPAFYEVNKQELGFCLYNGALYAWNVATGATLWSFTGDGELSTAPIVVNGLVFAGSYAGNIYALDAGTGAKKWSDSFGNTLAITSFGAGQNTLIVVFGNSSNMNVAAYGPK
ncbi:MAG: PQQ-binding-like beta-propeller repeat protein [Rhizomicrobium sp.]|jgi:outer membrane protein assembly factor BamB